MTFTAFIFLLHPCLLLASPCHHQDNSFFISLLRSYVMINKRKIIRWLRSLRHDLRVKNDFFLSLPTTFTTPWLREKPFFHFGITFNTPLLQKKKFDFIEPLLWLCYDYEKNVFVLFHWDVHYGNIFLHDLKSPTTSLTCWKKSRTVYSPKKTCLISSSGISVESYTIYFTNSLAMITQFL